MKRPKIQRQFLARPADGSWGLWVFGETDGPKEVASGSSCQELDVPSDSWVALPSAQMLAVPLWLATSDPGELKEMIMLQLEGKGFGASECLEFSIVKSEGSNTLVTAWVLPVLPPEVAELEMIARCVPSAAALPLRDNACTLWKEAGRWTCAVKSDGMVVAVQTCGALSLGGDLRTEVLCLSGQLLKEKCLGREPEEIVIWGAEDESGTKDWPLKIRHEPMPPPIWPVAPSFLPPVFARRKASQAKRRAIGRALAVASVLLALAAIGFVGHTAWLWMGYQRSAARLAAVEPQVSQIKGAAESWNAVAPAVDPTRSGVEILYRCARHIPPSGVRFTLFQIKEGTVLLVGEGDNVSGVVELQNKLANDKELAEYRWKMPPPRILPNNVARFEISGDRLGYASAEK